MNRNSKIAFILLIAAMPAIVYLYFYKWKTGTAYGDDLYMFKNYQGVAGFWDKINIPVSFGKFRPVHGLVTHFLIDLFQKDIQGYYVFNVQVQIINILLFSLVADLFLKSPLTSLCFGFVIGLSRFCYFNVSQLLNGGALEGLAMTFFLASLYFLLKACKEKEYSESRKIKIVLLSILFANLGLYTHERYIVMLLFISAVVLVFPSLKVIPIKKRLFLSAVSLLSIVLNVFLKKYIYHLPFFLGTGNTNISLSPSSAFSYLKEALFSILQINISPEFLSGIKFSSLPLVNKLVIIFLLISIAIVVTLYILKTFRALYSNWKGNYADFPLFLLLIVLCGLLLAPAIVTIRLEQRWLQASFSVWLLVVLIAGNHLRLKENSKNIFFTIFALLLIWVDFNYMKNGISNTYLAKSERTVTEFGKALKTGIVSPLSSQLYILEERKDSNTENGIRWELCNGYFFDFYQYKNKQITFIDSSFSIPFMFRDSTDVTGKSSFEVISMKNGIKNVTQDFLKSKLPAAFSEKNEAAIYQLIQPSLLIGAAGLDEFVTKGFYPAENNLRWTNGNSEISFKSDFPIKDTITLLLNTYMPPPCKDVKPEVSVFSAGGFEFKPFSTVRSGDQFVFKYSSAGLTGIRKIKISSQVIPSTPPDQRVLSFPLVSLELKK